MPKYAIDPTKRITIIVAGKRNKRPQLHGKLKSACPFDPGNEELTPQSKLEVGSLRWKWEARAFENKFPIVSKVEKYSAGKYITGGFGVHEVIVETPRHGEQFEKLSEAQLQSVFEAYVNRFEEISRFPGVKHVFLFKNHGKTAGASIDHEHSQIFGLPFVPELIQRELDQQRENNTCIYCQLAKQRRNLVFENEFFAVVRPEFARFALECWVIPKKHVGSFTDFDVEQRIEFMKTLQETLKRVKRKTQDYNFAFHGSNKHNNLHFHVEVYPHTDTLAGLELGAGAIVNPLRAADALRILK